MHFSFDHIAGVVALVLCVLGVRRGLVEELFRMFAVVASFAAAFFLLRPVAAALGFLHLPGPVSRAVAFVAVYLACLITVLLAGKIVKKIIHLTPLGMVDRIAGGTLGALKALFVCWIAVALISLSPLKRRSPFFTRSLFVSYTEKITPDLAVPMPGDLLKESLKKASHAKPSKTITSVQRKIETFRAMVDSAKEAQGDSQ
jgi:membrane protein required for colicin V production